MKKFSRTKGRNKILYGKMKQKFERVSQNTVKWKGLQTGRRMKHRMSVRKSWMGSGELISEQDARESEKMPACHLTPT